jgi:hypothetical protein
MFHKHYTKQVGKDLRYKGDLPGGTVGIFVGMLVGLRVGDVVVSWFVG